VGLGNHPKRSDFQMEILAGAARVSRRGKVGMTARTQRFVFELQKRLMQDAGWRIRYFSHLKQLAKVDWY
jgi:hypothetical protein